MCDFFSFVSNGRGKYFYFDWDIRQKILSMELTGYAADSHSSEDRRVCGWCLYKIVKKRFVNSVLYKHLVYLKYNKRNKYLTK